MENFENVIISYSAQWSKSIIRGWPKLFYIEKIVNSNSLFIKAKYSMQLSYIFPTKHTWLFIAVSCKKLRTSSVQSRISLKWAFLLNKQCINEVYIPKVPVNCQEVNFSNFFSKVYTPSIQKCHILLHKSATLSQKLCSVCIQYSSNPIYEIKKEKKLSAWSKLPKNVKDHSAV